MDARTQARVRSLATLAVLAALLVGGAAWAWSALTAPLPGGEATTSLCEPQTAPAGEPIRPDDVVVSVLNASGRLGLASVTLDSLEARGFVPGRQGNAPDDTDVARVEVWAEDPDNPSARLVASFFGPRTPVVARDTDGGGVTVVVGQRFDDVGRGRQRVVPQEETVICGPLPGTDTGTDVAVGSAG